MKIFFTMFVALFLFNAAQAEVSFSPSKQSSSDVEQIRVAFPESMEKVETPFNVVCDPEVKGYGNWADNNTTWVYNLDLEKNVYGDISPLPGGTGCRVEQAVELTSTSGTKYSVGSLKHEFVVEGPVVTSVYNLPGYNYSLRETSPVFMITFDGDIDKESLFNSNGNFLWYPVKDGYPSEKITLSEVPADKQKELYEAFRKEYGLRYNGVEFEKGNWALVTVNRDLIPGAEINLSLSGFKSAYSSAAVGVDKNETLNVREKFKLEVSCSRVSQDSSLCMPESSIRVSLTASAKWSDVKEAYIEYVPQGSEDGKTVKAYPSENGVAYNWLGGLAYSLKLFSLDDALVSNLNFRNVRVEPQTVARVHLPEGLQDADGRSLLSNTYNLIFGSYSEIIEFPERLTFMERKLEGNTALPVSIMNLNQKVTVVKTGTSVGNWMPITNMSQILELVVAYDSKSSYLGDDEYYVSPLDQLGYSNTTEEVVLNGEINQKDFLNTFLSLEYGGTKKSGLYAVEVKSSISNEKVPAYNLTVLTDLNVHLKKGESESIAWVTSYSTGLAVAGAKVDIYDCNNNIVKTGQTDTDGLYKFSQNGISVNCPEGSSYKYDEGSYFVAASTSEDMAFTHSSNRADGTVANYAPGVEFTYSDINDGSVYIHSLVGINLVKPGQTVPVQLTAVLPNQEGFTSVDSTKLPPEAIVSSNNSDVEYTFPLNWVNGAADFKWQVPVTADLGSYSIRIKSRPESSYYEAIGTDIEVSEFKVPLMSANLNLEKGPLIKPAELKVSGYIRFANGIGARDQEVEELAYYFAPNTLNVEGFTGFDFVQGEFGQENSETEAVKLPDFEQPATLKGLVTDSEGTISVDLAEQALESGETVTDLLALAKRPYAMIVRMKYQDQMGEFQTVSTSKNIYSSNSYIGSKVTSGTLEEAKLQAVDLSVEGKPVTKISDLEISVSEVKTHVIGEEVFGGFIKNTIEKELVATNWMPNCELVEGVANCSAQGLTQGYYILSVASKGLGQKTFSKFSVDIEGLVQAENDYYYFDEDVKGVVLAADKEAYKGGESAKLSFESPFETCSALVTLERAEVVESFIDNKACQNGFVSVPVSAKSAPNVFASVYFVAGRSETNVDFKSLDLGKPAYRLGFANLKIDWEKYALDVSVDMDREEYKPGDVATATVNVDAQMGDLSSASVTLIAVEEKILELKENKSMNILESLMGMRGHNVVTVNNFDYLNSVAEAEAAIVSAAAADDRAKYGEEGGSGSELESFQRKLFDALVAWETNVPVVNGQAQVSFKLNDKLTKFKVFAVVSDSLSKYGTGDTSYLSSQEVQTYSNIPSVARTGDEFPATVTVQNNGKVGETFTVVIDYIVKGDDGVVSPRSTTSSVLVEKGGSKSLALENIKIPEGANTIDYTITVYNENGIRVDGLTPPTQVVSPSVPLTVQDEFLAQIESGSVEFSLKKDERALAGQGLIDTKVFSSLVDSADYAVRKAISEDIFADITVEGKMIKALVESDETNRSAMVRAYSELLSQVDSEGFVKYYSAASRGSFWLTVDLVQLLAMKPWAMEIMPSSLRDKLVNSFSKVADGTLDATYLSSNPSDELWLVAKVKVANAMLEMGFEGALSNAQEVLTLVKEIKEFRTYPISILTDMATLTAYVEPQALMTSSVMKFIQEASLSLKDTSAILKGSPSYGLYGYADEVVATARLVKAQSNAALTTGVKSSENYLDNLVVGLVQANKNGKWYTSRTKAWVLKGLMGFAKTYEAVAVSGTTIVSTTSTTSLVNWSSASDEDQGTSAPWTGTEDTVTVGHDGQGKPWISVVAQAAVKLDAPNYQGLKVTKVVTNKSDNSGVFSAGDLIQVDITIDSPSVQPHVALFDPIPSGANILSDGWGAYSSAQKSYSGYKVYFELLTAGSVTLSYQYQLNNPGSFELPQTRVEALYEPGLFGEVPNTKMTVVK